MRWFKQKKHVSCSEKTNHTVRVRKVRSVPVIEAKYDAAQTTPDNYKHWANADFLSATASMTPAVRRTLRSRSRYEAANNSYAAGIVNTLAEYLIGTGPRLQLRLADTALYIYG